MKAANIGVISLLLYVWSFVCNTAEAIQHFKGDLFLFLWNESIFWGFVLVFDLFIAPLEH